MKDYLERFFKLKELNTNLRTEIIAGLTTFMTMAYIIFVNPAIISQAGIDFASAIMATSLSAAFSTILMGLYTNYPIALAAGMGQNTFFTYTVCLGMGISWQVALGCVFIEGILFILLTLSKIRQAIVEAIPFSLRSGIAAGIGLLIALVGLKEGGLIVTHPSTLLGLGEITHPVPILTFLGLIVSAVLLAKNIKGALLLGILFTTFIGIPLGIVKYQGIVSLPPSLNFTFMKMDILGALKLGLVSIIFVFLFMDLFDTVGTVAGLAELGGFIKNGKFPGLKKVMLVDAIGTCIGASLGTPTVTSYVESSAGIASGGRSGLSSIITGMGFLVATFFYPLVQMVGGGYRMPGGEILHPITAPALIIVGCLMGNSLSKIKWSDYTEAIPAFIAAIMIPFTFSIATGIAFGFISYAALKLLSARAKEVSWLIYILAIIFILRFLYLKIF